MEFHDLGEHCSAENCGQQGMKMCRGVVLGLVYVV